MRNPLFMLILSLLCSFNIGCSFSFDGGSDDSTTTTDNTDAIGDDDDDDSVPDDTDNPAAGGSECTQLWEYVDTPPPMFMDFPSFKDDFDLICNPDGADILALEKQQFDMINVDRADHAEEANDAEPLTYDCAVAEVARIHSYLMCAYGMIYHEFPYPVMPEEEVDTPQGRLETYLGLQFGPDTYDYFTFGENVAWHTDLQDAEDALVEEEPPCDTTDGGHRLNILNYNFSHVGVGYCDCDFPPMDYPSLDAGPYFYLTQNFITYDSAFIKDEENPYCGW